MEVKVYLSKIPIQGPLEERKLVRIVRKIAKILIEGLVTTSLGKTKFD